MYDCSGNKNKLIFLLIPFIGMFLAFRTLIVPRASSYCDSRFAYQSRVHEQPGEVSELLSFYSL